MNALHYPRLFYQIIQASKAAIKYHVGLCQRLKQQLTAHQIPLLPQYEPSNGFRPFSACYWPIDQDTPYLHENKSSWKYYRRSAKPWSKNLCLQPSPNQSSRLLFNESIEGIVYDGQTSLGNLTIPRIIDPSSNSPLMARKPYLELFEKIFGLPSHKFLLAPGQENTDFLYFKSCVSIGGDTNWNGTTPS